MSARIKSALLLALMLVIGMVLGAMINARLVENRFARLAALRSERGFIRYWERAVEPVDDEQRAAVRAILDEAAARVTEVQSRHRAEMRTIIESARAELADVLTEEQMARLDARIQMRPPRRDGPRGRRGPPPRGRVMPPDSMP